MYLSKVTGIVIWWYVALLDLFDRCPIYFHLSLWWKNFNFFGDCGIRKCQQEKNELSLLLFVSNFLKMSWLTTNLDRKKPSLNFPKLNRFFPVFGTETSPVFLPVSIPGLLLTISHFLIIDLWGENCLLSDFRNAGGFQSKKFGRK